MTPDWESLATPDDWRTALLGLLADAGKALRSGDADARTLVKSDLMEFVDESPHEVGEDLDPVAMDAIRALSKANVDGTLADLESRSADLARLAGSLADAAAGNAAAAASIRRDWARREAESLTRAVDSLHQLRASLRRRRVDEELAARIDAVLAALEDVREGGAA